MRQGYKVIDVDTHVTPSYEVLMRYADEELKSRADELLPYVRPTKPTPGRGHPTEEYGVIRVDPYPFERMAGRKYGEAESGAGAKGALEGKVKNEATGSVRDRIQHDNAEGRLLDMDVEGVDINLIIRGRGRPVRRRSSSGSGRRCTARTTGTWPTSPAPTPAV